ncbi:MAG TPA: TonB-dependent receptor, partial [Terriglobales bacterium]|nr:TonB-dependent receptor [Terriglobales bacterium]
FFSRRQVATDLDTVFGFTSGIVGGVDATTSEQRRLDNAATALWGFAINDTNGEFFDKAGTRQGSSFSDFRQHEWDLYAQDTWKMRHNLTLSYGLRYQFNGVPTEQSANFSNLLRDPGSFAAGEDVTFTVVGPGTGKQVFNNDYSNFEPRIGLSWDPWSDGKTAIRAGFAIFHDRVFGNLFTNARGNPPFELDYTTFPGGLAFETLNNFYGTDTFPLVAPDTTPSATIPDGSQLTTPVIFDPHFRNPMSNNWNLGIQREIYNNLTLDVTYQGSQSHHMFRSLDGNPPDPGLVQQLLDFCSNPGNAFGCTTNDVSSLLLFEGAERQALPFNAVANDALEQPVYNRSNGDANYNALQVKVTRRLTHGLQVQGAYTWAHSNDNANDPIDAAAGNRNFPRNSRNLRLEYGNSDIDIRHTAVINYLYEMPFGKGRGYLNTGVVGRILEGMQLSGITTFQSGHPFDIFSSTDSQRTGVSQRADIVGDPYTSGANDANGPANGAKIWFRNPDAFVEPLDASGNIPIPGRPGTTGKNQFYGPGFVNFDMTWAKKMSFGERVGAELRFECYNLFNHPHFLNPNNGITSSVFGLITGTAGRSDGTTSARQMQVALKVIF